MHYARGWELTLVAAIVCGAAFGAAVLTAVGIASELFGRGWVWPDDLASAPAVVAGVLVGHPGRGLPPAASLRLADPAVIYIFVLAFEVGTVVTLVRGTVGVVRRLRNDGMATRGEARQALGLEELNRAAAIIRPDLVGRRRTAFHMRGRRPRASTHLRSDRHKDARSIATNDWNWS